MRRHWIVIAAIVLLLAGLPQVAGDHDDGNGPDTGECATAQRRDFADMRGNDVVCVDILGIEPFAPAVLVIDAGTTVVWRNQDGIQHTVTSTAEGGLDSFDHRVFPGDHEWTTLDDPGSYYYQCRVNFPFHAASMHGEIIVAP